MSYSNSFTRSKRRVRAKPALIRPFEKQLRDAALLDDNGKANIENRIKEELESDLQFALDSPFPQPERALEGVYAQPATNSNKR